MKSFSKTKKFNTRPYTISTIWGNYFYLLGNTFISLGLGVALAVFVMMITNTVHPPAGANPIIVILTSQSISFVFLPVAVGAIIIVAFAYLYNKLLKRNYI